jgi:hypothetical protein
VTYQIELLTPQVVAFPITQEEVLVLWFGAVWFVWLPVGQEGEKAQVEEEEGKVAIPSACFLVTWRASGNGVRRL